MSDNFSIEIESNSTKAGISLFQVCHKEKKEKKLLTNKRMRDEEASQIQMLEEFPEPKEEDEERIAYIENFPMNQETSISSEAEESYESDERFYMRSVKKERSLLETFYPDYYLFTKMKEILFEPYMKEFDFSITKRSTKRLPNYLQKHYIRVNIKRSFMNTHLLKALKKKLKKAGFKNFFRKFPQNFANNVAKDLNKILMNMRLKEIFRAKDLYIDINVKNYEHNLKLVKEIEEGGNLELNMILNRKFRCLFEEYVNSEEFRKVEINRIKKSTKKNNEYYERKFIYLAEHYIEFCFQ